jgi:hypothetical protein
MAMVTGRTFTQCGQVVQSLCQFWHDDCELPLPCELNREADGRQLARFDTLAGVSACWFHVKEVSIVPAGHMDLVRNVHTASYESTFISNVTSPPQ